MTQLEHFDLHDSDFESSSSPPFPALKETISASIIVSNLIRIPIPNGKICRIRRSTLINLLKSAKDPAAIFGLQGNGEKEKMEMKKRLKAMSPVLFLVNVNPRSQSLNLQNVCQISVHFSLRQNYIHQIARNLPNRLFK